MTIKSIFNTRILESPKQLRKDNSFSRALSTYSERSLRQIAKLFSSERRKPISQSQSVKLTKRGSVKSELLDYVAKLLPSADRKAKHASWDEKTDSKRTSMRNSIHNQPFFVCSLSEDESKELFLQDFAHQTKDAVSMDAMLHGYKVIMSSQELFSRIFDVVNSDNTSEMMKSALLDFCHEWLQSSLYTKDLQDKSVADLIKKIGFKACRTKSIEIQRKGRAVLKLLKRNHNYKDVKLNLVSGGTTIDALFTNALTSRKLYRTAVAQLTSDIHSIFSHDILRFNTDELFVDWVKMQSPGVQAISDHVNQIGGFVAKSILESKNQKEAKIKASLFIDVASNCIQKGDFQSGFALYLGLTNAAVERVLFPKGQKPILNGKYQQKLNQLQELYSLANNQAALKKAYTQHETYIPSFSKLLNEIQFMKENATYLSATGEVNTDKLKLMAHEVQKINEIKSAAAENHQRVLATDLAVSLQAYPALGTPGCDKVLYPLSYQLRPRGK